MEFNSELFFGNINYLLHVQDKRTGKFETEAGVKPGYMSRMSKDSKPGIDFIMKAADILGISVDSLLKVNISELNPTEKYFFDFMEKLKHDTDARKLNWEVESADYLNRYAKNTCGGIMHPLFSEETFYIPEEDGYSREVTEIIFKSHTYECNTSINRPCYNLRLKNGVMVYIMNIKLAWGTLSEINKSRVYEVWMHNPDIGGSRYIANSVVGSPLAEIIKSLYSSISEYNRCPKIPETLAHAIDAFMNDDMSDDEVEIPF